MSTTLVRESEIEAYLVKRVRKAGGITYKFVSPGVAGVPDRIVLNDGDVFFVEVKAPGKKMTALQVQTMVKLQTHGARTACVSTKEEVDTFVDCCL